jgi:nitrate reductase gamma subunit
VLLAIAVVAFVVVFVRSDAAVRVLLGVAAGIVVVIGGTGMLVGRLEGSGSGGGSDATDITYTGDWTSDSSSDSGSGDGGGSWD